MKGQSRYKGEGYGYEVAKTGKNVLMMMMYDRNTIEEDLPPQWEVCKKVVDIDR